MFSQASVILSKGVRCAWQGGMCDRGHVWQGACMVGGRVCQGGMHGRGMAGGMCMAGEACIARGMHSRWVCMAGRGVYGRGHVWQERRPLQWIVHILLECIVVSKILQLKGVLLASSQSIEPLNH